MDIATFARQQWGQHERDANAAAEEYLKEALEGRDPYESLIKAVRIAMGYEFRNLRRVMERQAPSWDAQVLARHVFPAGESPAQMRAALTDQRAQLLRERVWTATRGWVLWADITAEDIEKTITEYRQLANGVERKIERLDSARRVIEKFEVERLGDAPWEEITGLVQGEPNDATIAKTVTAHPGHK